MNSVAIIEHKKIPRHKIHGDVDGLAFPGEKKIVLQDYLKGYNHFYTLIHEIMHLQNPKWPEMKVRGHSEEMAKLLWKQRYRRVDL